MSRRALYHHFSNKEDLFLAVLKEPAMRLRAGCMAWLELAQDHEIQQIALIDAPSVVSRETLRQVDGRIYSVT